MREPEPPANTTAPPGIDWCAAAASFAIERGMVHEEAVHRYWIRKEPLPVVARALGITTTEARELVREGIEHCIERYLSSYCLTFATVEARRLVILEMTARYIEVTQPIADISGSQQQA